MSEADQLREELRGTSQRIDALENELASTRNELGAYKRSQASLEAQLVKSHEELSSFKLKDLNKGLNNTLACTGPPTSPAERATL
jgi:septal ring factor EnvC (AmiA/AmiB activator)